MKKVLILVVVILGHFAARPALAESTSQALIDWDLVGTWAVDCVTLTAPRIIVDASLSGSFYTSIRHANDGNGIKMYQSTREIISAIRVTADQIKITTIAVTTMVDGVVTTTGVGDSNEMLYQRFGDKIRIMSDREMGSNLLFVSNGQSYFPVVSNNSTQMQPVGKGTLLSHKCPN